MECLVLSCPVCFGEFGGRLLVQMSVWRDDLEISEDFGVEHS
jgi:hypothetical protein